MDPKVILHIDMDAFFAAVEQRDNPRLKGKPVIIGADPKGGSGRGVVSTCSYEARPFGVHSAMPISQAFRLCPQGIYLRGDHQKYRDVSTEIFKILSEFTPMIQPISIDEAFLDITGSLNLFGAPKTIGYKIKERILKQLRLTASIGIAPNKMVAKIASDLCKPDGLLEVLPEHMLEFLYPLNIERLWGVGQKTKQSLNTMGIIKIGDLAETPVTMLEEHFGEHGRHLHALATGNDYRPVEEEEDVKSVSNEYTFETDTSDRDEILDKLLGLSEKVSRRLRKKDLKGKTITLKVRLKGFHTYTRAHTLKERTNFSDVIYREAKALYEEFDQPQNQIRLIGVRVSNFEDPYVQDSLFEDAGASKDEHLHQAFDRIKDKFGEQAIRRGTYRDGT